MHTSRPHRSDAFAIAATLILACSAGRAQEPLGAQPLAHFHHLHLNTTDRKAAIEFYTSRFDCEKAKFGGVADAVWAQKSWILFNEVKQPPPSEIVSALYHFGWGAEDMKATYRKQIDMGTKFQTPITDITAIMGRGKPDTFFFAYVDGPDHALIELNTANHHQFGHIHMVSADPIAAGEWYVKEFGMSRRGSGSVSREVYAYKGVQFSPGVSLMLDNVNFIIWPIGFESGLFPKEWAGRTELEPTKGRVMDHFGLSVDNLGETIARLRMDGVKVTEEPRTVLGGKLKIAFIEGPDKVRIELVEGLAQKE
jgi:catechol 2,3-dioxygenase-like lactoylglutathione lyase family enzyme